MVKLKLPQRKFTSSNTLDFIINNKKGIGTVRQIISRRHPRADIHNPKRWRKKLDCPEVTRKRIKESTARLHSKFDDTPKVGQNLF